MNVQLFLEMTLSNNKFSGNNWWGIKSILCFKVLCSPIDDSKTTT